LHVSLLVHNFKIKIEELQNFRLTQRTTGLRASFTERHISDQPGH